MEIGRPTVDDVKSEPGKKLASWPQIGLILLLGVGFSAWVLPHDFIPHAWVMPPESKLLHAVGTFDSSIYGSGRPYSFRTNSGEVITLGCEPEGPSTRCLGEVGINLGFIAGHRAEIAYFYVLNYARPSLSNVLVSVKVGNSELLSYSRRKAEIKSWGAREERFKHSPWNIALDLLGATIALIVTLPIILKKNRLRRQGHVRLS